MQRSESRGKRRAVSAWLLLSLVGTSAAAGQTSAPPPGPPEAALPSVRLSPPRELHVGEHARLELELLLPRDAAGPLLLTPFHEGQALEVVKGRLLRSDARDPAARPLRFELPVLARAAGVARVGVRLLAYVCDVGADKRCRAIEAESRADVLVLP